MLRRVVPYLIYIILVGGLITVIILAFHSDNANEPAKPIPSSTANTGAAGQSVTVTPQGGNPQPTNSASNTSTASGSSQTPAAASPSQLTNTGPGDVLAVFVGGVVVGTIGFSLYQKRQSSLY